MQKNDIPLNGIQAVVGKPGGGKGAYTVHVAIDWLVNTKFKIVGNFALCVPKIYDYLNEHFKGHDIDVLTRIVQLSDDQARYFYRYRTHEHLKNPLPFIDIDTKKIIPDCDYTPQNSRTGVKIDCDEPVLYLIDEAQNLFNNRDFANTGFAVRWYLSQHRKYHDCILLNTQNMSLVDKSFRSWCQNFVYCRNLRKEMVNKWFRAPPKFRRMVYLSALESNPQQQPEMVVEVDFDTKLLACYDTNAGVGVLSKQKGGEQINQRGLSTKWVIYPAIVLVFLACLFFAFLPRILAKFGQTVAKSTVATTTTLVSTAPSPSSTASTPAPAGSVVSSVSPVPEDKDMVDTILTLSRCDVPDFIAKLNNAALGEKVFAIDDTRVFIRHDKKYSNLIAQLDAPTTAYDIVIDIAQVQNSKDFNFSLASLNLDAENVFKLSAGSAVNLNLGKLIFDFAKTKGNAVQTDTYRLHCIRNIPSQFSRGVEIPILSQSVSNGTVTSSTTYKPVLNNFKVTARTTPDDFVELNFDVALQNLVDTKTTAISSTTYKNTVRLKHGQSVVLFDLANKLQSKSTGWFSHATNDDSTTYLVTVHLLPR